GDTVVWQIVLSGAHGDASIELPVMADWDMVSKSRASSTNINLTGGGSQIVHQSMLNVVLSPRRTGTLPIPAAHVHLGGKDYETSTLSVKVLPAGSTPPGGGRHRQPQAQDQDPDPF